MPSMESMPSPPWPSALVLAADITKTQAVAAAASSSGLNGASVGNVSIVLFGFILAAAGLVAVGFVGCFSVGRFRGRFADSPLNPYRVPTSTRAGIGFPGGGIGSGVNPWFDDPFARMARERRRAEEWAKDVAQLTTRPVFWEAKIATSGDEDASEMLPLAARLLPAGSSQQPVTFPSPSSLSSKFSASATRGTRVVRTTVIIRLPCPPPTSSSELSGARSDGALSEHDLQEDEQAEGEPEDLPEFDLGIEVLSLEGVWK